MAIIEASGLTKTYRVYQKRGGFLGGVRGLFHREYKEVHAARDVTFTIEPGEMVAFLGPNARQDHHAQDALRLIYPSSGDARVLGFVPWSGPTPSAGSSASSWGKRISSGGDLPAADSFQLHREIYSCRPPTSTAPSVS
jgi:ABC-2 type transport system ATP-binding protein